MTINSEIASEISRIEKIVKTVTGRDLRDKLRDHKNVIARSIFYKISYDYLCRIGVRTGAKNYVARYMNKNHATILHAMNNFNEDILGSSLNKKMYDTSVEVFGSLGDIYKNIDKRDLEIDDLKNKITDLQLELSKVKPYRKDIEHLVDLLLKIPSDKIDDAEFRIGVMLKGFAIEPRNQKTQIIGSYETIGSS
tara:strand:- start:170 stop:751 length:582 start_codon:yes stop_codon:yes gene_type:complete